MQKVFDVEGPAARAGAAKLSKTAKDNRSDTPSTLPKAGVADFNASPLPPTPFLISVGSLYS